LLELRGFARGISGDSGGLEDFERSIALATEIHSSEHVHTALNNLAVIQIAMGQLEAAHESLAAIKRNAERYATPSRLRWVEVIDTEFGLIDGDWAEVDRVTSRLIAASEAGDPHYTDYSCRLLRASVRRASGDLPGAVDDMEQCLALARATADAQVMGPSLIAAASVLLEAGRGDEAATLAREALAMGIRLVVVSQSMALVDGAWLMRDVGLQSEYAALLGESLATPWVEAASAICSGELSRAADLLGNIGCRSGEAYARLRVAKQLVEEGRRPEADLELGRALAFYREAGATGYVREGEALLAASA
jgi:tetratricopeptide (TPR) repeat protein